MHFPENVLAALYTAVIGGAFTFVGAVLTKESKTSEFRQTWIDQLRSDLADYMSKTEVLLTLLHTASKNKAITQEKFYSEYRQEIEKIRSLETKIILRLNSTEHENFISAIRTFGDQIVTSLQIEDRMTQAETDTISGVERNFRALVTKSHVVLKYEWKRVKQGEPIYRATKWTSLVLTVILLIVGAASLL